MKETKRKWSNTTPEGIKRYTIYMEIKLYDDLKVYAQKNKITIMKVIDEAIKNRIKK